MASLSARRVTPDDYPLIRYSCICKWIKIGVKNRNKLSPKTWIDHVDLESVIEYVMSNEYSFIVDDTYLVVYDIHTPWYNHHISILSETLVGKLTKHKSDFSVVPRFLEQQAKEAGCELAFAGTALATSDDALASLYEADGFNRECILLTKRI